MTTPDGELLPHAEGRTRPPMSLGETRPGPTRPVRLHRRLLQPTTDPLCHRLQNARTSREASGVTPVSIKSGDHQSANLCDQYGWSGGDRTGLATLPIDLP